MNNEDEISRWESAYIPPLIPGNYRIKIKRIEGLNQIEWDAAYRKDPTTFKDDLVWDVPSGFIVTHWRL